MFFLTKPLILAFYYYFQYQVKCSRFLPDFQICGYKKLQEITFNDDRNHRELVGCSSKLTRKDISYLTEKSL